MKPRYCATCRAGCTLVAKATILRGPNCPFLKKYAPGLEARGIRVPVQHAEDVRSGVLATGLPHESEFTWRGRVRRNVPGG